MPNRSWRQLALEPGSERHVVQIYRDAAFLEEAVTRWILPALRQPGGALLVCTPENASRIRGRVAAEGLDVQALEQADRLVILDADALLARFMLDGVPDGDRFKAIVREAVARVRPVPGAATDVRAWGEMVNLLWHRGQREAARRLEGLWNEAIDELDLRLLCSYGVDNLSPETHGDVLREICEGHSHLIPEADYAAFDAALSAALVEVYGEQDAGIVRATLARQRVLATSMPAAEAVLVALAERDPPSAARVLAATRAHMLAQP